MIRKIADIDIVVFAVFKNVFYVACDIFNIGAKCIQIETVDVDCAVF